MEKRFDLTQSQLLIWMGQKLSPDSPAYNMAILFDFSMDINIPVFKSAFQMLIQQSDVMRTLFTEENGQAKQVIKTNLPYELDVLDFSNKPNKETYTKEWLDKRCQIVFDISKCLFDSVLIQLDEKRFLWYFNQHHLITDAWAMTLQYKALVHFYKNILDQVDLPASLLPPFESYIKYEADKKWNKPNNPTLEYWRNKAQLLPDSPDFFGQSNRDLESRSERKTIKLDLQKSEALRALTKETDLRAWTQDLALFNIFSALLFAYIYRISGQQKLTIGTPVHNRISSDFKETAGLFMELFPLMVELDAEENFSDLIQKMRNESHDFLKYAQVGASASKLNKRFNVTLNYINASFREFEDISMTSEWIHSGHADPGHHIRLQVYDFDASGCIVLGFDLNTAVFDEAQRKAAPVQFMKLLDSFIDDRFQKIGKPSLIAQKGISVENLGSDFFFQDQLTVLDLFEGQVTQLSEGHNALRFGEKDLDYNELNKHAEQLASYLIKNGLKLGESVAILLQRSPEFIISLLATMKAGAVFIPIPSNYPSGRVLGILEDAQAKIILSNTVLSAALRKSFDNIICLDKETIFIQQEVTLRVYPKVSPNDLAYIMYTSGSTGLPKGVMIEHKALSHYLQWAEDYYVQGFRPEVPLFTSIGFDLTITSMFLPLIAGGTLHIYAEPENGPDLALFQVLEDNLVNLIKLTPSHLALLTAQTYKASQLACMIVGGENFKTSLAEYVCNNFKEGINIYNEYGPTEATVGCVVQSYKSKQFSEDTSVPIGLPIANTSIYILDEFGNQVPDGLIGELHLSGIGLAKGYWKQEQLSQAQFIPNPFVENTLMYRTGDLVRRHSKGYLEYFGRKDLQVKIRGRRVELAEIETVLNQHPLIDQGIVELRERRKLKGKKEVHNCVEYGSASNTQIQDADKSKEQLVAYYISEKEVTEAELRAYLLNHFPDYMVPVQFIKLDHLPLTVNGKIDRAALPQPDAIRPVLKIEYVEARNEFEEIISEIWSEVLQIDRIGVLDSFIDVGGDSLSGIRIMARINSTFELDLPVQTIFQHSTIEKLGTHLEETIKILLMELDSTESA